MKKVTALLLSLAALLTTARADVPHLINYQGRLLLGTNLVNGNVGMALRLFNVSSGGTVLFEDTGTVSVVDGIYSTFIGDQTNAGFFVSTFTNSALWVEVAVNGATLTPRERIASVAHALSVRGLLVTSNGNFIANPLRNVLSGTTNEGGNVILGDLNKLSNTYFSVIGGGVANGIRSASDLSVIGGGANNFIHTNAPISVIGGGQNNNINNNAGGSVVAGGLGNFISTDSSNAVVSGGSENTISMRSPNSTIGGGEYNTILTDAPRATIGGGLSNSTAAAYSTIAGGLGNASPLFASYSTIGGGQNNTALDRATVGGGFRNLAGGYALVGGGFDNTANAIASVVAGGSSNYAGGGSSTIGGGHQNTVYDSADYATIGGGLRNLASLRGTVAGGIDNYAGSDSFVGGGNFNSATSLNSTVAGGYGNIARSPYAFIGGGNANSIFTRSTNAVIGGGWLNLIRTNAQNATIGGGFLNVIWDNVQNGTISGGNDNWVRGDYGTVAGGYSCIATSFAYAVGRDANANHVGAFVWGDSTPAAVNSSASNQVTFRASGGFRIYTDPGLTIGAILNSNTASWAALSDRNAKQDFAPVNHDETLRKLIALPVTAWSYKADPDHRRYIGPMAQDFHAAFNLGNDTTINTLDTDGVALSAIQGLNAKLERENTALRTDLEQTRAELEALKARLDALAPPR